MFDCPQCNTRHNTGEQCATIIPQSFIDTVQLELDELLQTLKDHGPDYITVERLALFLFDKKGVPMSDLEHRQILTVMVAILLKREASNG